MKLNVLNSFLTVARLQNISRAASVLYISQPALSRQIKELEEEVGSTLIIRGNKNVSLTPEGLLLQKRAKQIVELVEKTKGELSSTEEDVGGTIYIVGGETHAFKLLANTFHKLHQEYPNIHIRLFSGNMDAVNERLDREMADFGLVIEPADITQYEYLRLPFKDRWGVLMRKDSPLAKLDAIEPQNLWDVPLINSQQALKGGQLSSWMKIEPEKLNCVASYNLLFNASILVAAGVGYALCLDNIIDTTGDTDLCFRPLSPPLESHVDLIWKKHQVFSKASKLFLERVRIECGEIKD